MSDKQAPAREASGSWPGRRFLVRCRDALDRWLHPARHRRAKTRLRALDASSVLFVCLGNVCRSPYAARFMESRSSGNVDIASAGFIGPGRPPPDTALSVARERGIDHSDHRSRTITAQALGAADALLVFDRFNVRELRRQPDVRMGRVFWLNDFDPTWSGKRAIIDPWGKDAAEFHGTFARIERCVTELLAVLNGSDPSSPDRSSSDGSP